ncbi:MAG TPA: hypothetical protein VIO16_00370, partial [Dehalococcoidia bacterium]
MNNKGRPISPATIFRLASTVRGVPPALKADLKLQPPVDDLLQRPVGLLERQRDRLFREYVFAGVDGGRDDSGVRFGCGGDNDCVDKILRKQLFRGRKAGGTELSRSPREGRRVGVADGGQSGAANAACKVRGVQTADFTQPDHAHPNGLDHCL